LLKIWPSAQMEADVSSQEDSIPSITGTLKIQKFKNQFSKLWLMKKVKEINVNMCKN